MDLFSSPHRTVTMSERPVDDTTSNDGKFEFLILTPVCRLYHDFNYRNDLASEAVFTANTAVEQLYKALGESPPVTLPVVTGTECGLY